MTRWLWILVLTTAFIFVGGMREILFVNINSQIEYNMGRTSSYHVLDYLSFLNDWRTPTLEKAKWILTVVVMLVNYILSALALKRALGRKDAVQWLNLLYASGFLISGGLFVLGKVLGNPDMGYLLARKVMGGLQSPFPLMMLIPALYLLPKRE